MRLAGLLSVDFIDLLPEQLEGSSHHGLYLFKEIRKSIFAVALPTELQLPQQLAGFEPATYRLSKKIRRKIFYSLNNTIAKGVPTIQKYHKKSYNPLILIDLSKNKSIVHPFNHKPKNILKDIFISKMIAKKPHKTTFD